MEKFCIFCGKKPEKKSNEHVLPQWLISLTGESKRIISLGLLRQGDTISEKRFGINSFKFPSCKSCNEKFSLLESTTKFIMQKILFSDNLSAQELNTLFDWFDKIRIGLWLAYYYLQHNLALIKPKFNVSSRLGLHDRML
ncbi:MAG TPA: hypothetical protein VM123_08810 [archaeon]|nr:hypothetical protein [archaeon]